MSPNTKRTTTTEIIEETTVPRELVGKTITSKEYATKTTIEVSIKSQ